MYKEQNILVDQTLHTFKHVISYCTETNPPLGCCEAVECSLRKANVWVWTIAKQDGGLISWLQVIANLGGG